MKIHSLMCSVSGPVLVLACAGMAQPAWAQDSAATPDQPAPPKADKPTDKGSDIVITGVRASVASAVSTKRRAEQLVDSISAQDIGALPDRSVAETLQRIPGVALTRTQSEFTTGRPTDPGRFAPEGGGVTIRGLTNSLSQSNGRDIFSAGNGRTLDWSDISSDLIAGVDVYKNPSAELTEGGISGIINLRGRKPFDQSGQLISMSGDVSYGDLQKKAHWSGNALYSNRWQVGGGEIGILLAGSLNNKGTRTDSIQTSAYGPYTLTTNVGGLTAGTEVYRPGGPGYRIIDWYQRRIMLNGVVQISPSPDMTFTFDAAYSKATPHELEYAMLDYSPPTEDSSWQFGPNKTVIAGSSPATNLDLDTRIGRYKLQTRDFSINWTYAPEGTHWLFSVDAQRLSSSADVYSMTGFTEFGNTGSTVNFTDAGRPTIYFNYGNNPSLYVKPPTGGYALDQQSNYWWAAAMDHIERETAGQWAYRADIKYSFDNSFIKSIGVGVRTTDRDYLTKQATYNWSLLSSEYWGGGSPVYLNQNASPGLSSQSVFYDFPDFFHGSVPAPGVGWFPSASLLATTANAYKYLQATETAGWGWSPLTEASYNTSSGQGNTIDQKEKTRAAYALLRFGADKSPLGRFEGNIGVRVVNTRYDTVGSFSIGGAQATVNGCLVANAANPALCSALQQAVAFAGGNIASALPSFSATGVPFHNNYTNVLPSLNINFHLTDRLQWRFAAGKSMVRPDFHQTSPLFSYNWNFDNTGAVKPGQAPYTGTVANPLLKPMTSWQGDTSIEYYWGKSNALTLALFYKDIANQIITTAYISNLTNNGVTLPFQVVENVNSNKHAKIKGFEVGYTQFFDFLPGPLGGLGVQANYTYVDATGGLNSAYSASLTNAVAVSTSNLPYEQLSKYQYNVALLYTKYGIDLRLAYNWRSHYLLTTISAGNFSPTWMESYGQADGSIFYSINKNIKIGLQATNLFNAKTYLDTSALNNGNVQPFQPRTQITDKDRVVDFAVRVRF